MVRANKGNLWGQSVGKIKIFFERTLPQKLNGKSIIHYIKVV